MKKTFRILLLAAMATAVGGAILNVLALINGGGVGTEHIQLIVGSGLLLLTVALFLTVKKDRPVLGMPVITSLLSLGITVFMVTWIMDAAAPLPEDASEMLRAATFFGWLLLTVSGMLCLTVSVMCLVQQISQRQTSSVRLAKKNFWGNIILGIVWLLAGVTGLVPPLKLLNIGLYILASVLAFWGMSVKGDTFDEMAEANYHQAKAKTLDYLCIIVMVVTLLLMLCNDGAPFRWVLERVGGFELVYSCALMVMGIREILVGMIFRKLEAE